MADCDSFRKKIDAMVVDQLSPRDWQRLRAHLTACPSCRERHDRAALLNRVLHGGPTSMDAPSPAALARIGAAVFYGVDERPKKKRRALPRWALGLIVLGASAAAVVPLVVRSHHESPNGGFTARGAVDPGPQVGLRAFCLAPDGSDVRPMADGAAARCRTDELLKLAYTNRAGFEDLFVVGFDDDWTVKWYEPRPPSGVSVPAAAASDQPVGGAVRIGVNHAPGPVRVFALFSHAPVATR